VRVSVIIPTHNETQAIGRVLSDLPSDLVTEVIVVDSNSNDGTPEIAARMGARVVQEPRRGYGRACLTGLAAANSPDVVVFLDGDYSDRPSELPLLLAPIIDGPADLRADITLGSRLHNQRSAGALPWHQVFGNRLAAGRRKDDATAVLMADIDHFKRLNDRFGHSTGDTVLRAVADAIARTVRTDDFPIRYGGEEFLVVLRRADRQIATAVAERLRKNVAGVDLRRVRITQPVTMSVGVAVAERTGEDLGALIERADAALFRAKAAGRDRIALS
jgi:diguanylate cyclase (GGDEF)-like protein